MDDDCRPMVPKGCLRKPLGKEVKGRLEAKKFKPTASQGFCFVFLGEGLRGATFLEGYRSGPPTHTPGLTKLVARHRPPSAMARGGASNSVRRTP